jgi:uncharacterized protein (TIGR01777 family)
MQFFTQLPSAKSGSFVPQKKKQKVLIAGITGTVATTIADHLLSQGHQVFGISRDPGRAARRLDPRISLLSWPQLSPGFVASTEITAIVNCAGAPMIQRWTHNAKAEILISRMQATRNLYQLLRSLPAALRPECFINASSVAIYSNRQLPVDESDIPDMDQHFFQSRVWHQLESLINSLQVPRVRSVVARMGVVIGPDEMMRSMLRASRFFMGAVLGSGRQKISWISHRDMARAIEHLILNQHLHGVFNIVSPQSTTSAGLSTGIAKSVSRQVFLRLPRGVLRRLFGELADNFMISAEVRPRRLANAGFVWELPDFDRAVQVAARQLGFPASLPEPTGSATPATCAPDMAAGQRGIATPRTV